VKVKADVVTYENKNVKTEWMRLTVEAVGDQPLDAADMKETHWLQFAKATSYDPKGNKMPIGTDSNYRIPLLQYLVRRGLQPSAAAVLTQINLAILGVTPVQMLLGTQLMGTISRRADDEFLDITNSASPYADDSGYATRTPTALAFFDRPGSPVVLAPGDKDVYEFKSYLVYRGKVAYVIEWQLVISTDKDGNATYNYTVPKGQKVTTLPKELSGKYLHVGEYDDDPEECPNPVTGVLK
jgi:hypothetical protein